MPNRANRADEVDRLRREAAETLARGEYERARQKFEEVLRRLPGDPDAQRDAARAAQAAGEFEYAANALERAHHFGEHKADPELHYLRGEALYVLKRPREAEREHRICELEIGAAPTERMQRLWMARIYARRGYLVLADRLYDAMWPPAPRVDIEVAMNQADAHLLQEDWAGAERVLKRFLERDPKHLRGRAMLAWALEARGDLNGEMRVRASLAEDDPTAINRRDFGRALERAADYRGAYREYAAAERLGADNDGTLSTSVQKMRYRTTPELAGAMSARTDPLASSLRLQAAGALPFGARHVVSFNAWRDLSRGGFPGGQGGVTGFGTSLLLGSRGGRTLVLGGELRYMFGEVVTHGIVLAQNQRATGGGIAETDLPFLGRFQLSVRADLNTQWGEAPITIQEGGNVTGVTSHLYLFAMDRRVLFDLGTQLRRLTLSQREGDTYSPRADQALLFVGADVVLWTTPARLLRGEALDERMLRRSYLNDAGILSYRHYQLFSDVDPAFAGRLSLVPRAAIHNGSATFRKVIAGGRAAFDLRGGAGYDTERRRFLSQGGASLVIAPSWASRVALSYDLARETATGLSGTVHTAWLTYHADADF